MIIDRYIDAIGHGRSKIYGINGSEKADIKQKVFMIDTEESDNKRMRINVAFMIFWQEPGV